MNLPQIDILAGLYEADLMNEVEIKKKELDAQKLVGRLKADILSPAYVADEIGGKNAEARKAQEHVLMVAREDYVEAVVLLDEIELLVLEAEAVRKAREAEVSLIRAWLYSQCKIG